MSEEVAVGEQESRESAIDRFGLRLYAVLLISAGVASIGEMVLGLFQDRLYIDLSFLGIFIGRGLLARSATWRAWAVVVAWLGILAAPVGIVVLAVVQPLEYNAFGIKTEWPTLWYAGFVFLAIQLAVCLWFRRILAKPTVRETFTEKGQGSDGWWLVIAFVSLLAWGGTAVLASIHEDLIEWECETIRREVTHSGEATIELVDEASGEVLSPTCSSYPANYDAKNKLAAMFPIVTVGFRVTGDGKADIHVSWVGRESFSIEVGAEGYQEKEISIGRDDDGKTIQVKLARLPDAEQAEPPVVGSVPGGVIDKALAIDRGTWGPGGGFS